MMIRITSHIKHHSQYFEVDGLDSTVSMQNDFVRKYSCNKYSAVLFMSSQQVTITPEVVSL